MAQAEGLLWCWVMCGAEAEALAIARTVVAERLAACANLVPGIRSVYRWQGAVEEASETALVLKTRADRFEALRARIVTLHSYDCPCILALPLVAGHPAYLAWLGNSAAPLDGP